MFASLHTASLATRRVQVRARPANSLTGLVRLATQALAARRQRKALAALDDRALRDIGVTRMAALTEADRPLWDVPAHWRR